MSVSVSINVIYVCSIIVVSISVNVILILSAFLPIIVFLIIILGIVSSVSERVYLVAKFSGFPVRFFLGFPNPNTASRAV